MKLLFLLLISSSTLFAAPKDSTITRTSIPFEKNTLVSSLIVIQGQLNGKNAYFLVDCGSEATILAKSQEQVFGFVSSEDNNNSNVDWSGNAVPMCWAEHAKILVGGIEYNRNIHSADIDNLLANVSRRSGRNVIGILGADFLSHNHLVIDYSTRTIHE